LEGIKTIQISKDFKFHTADDFECKKHSSDGEKCLLKGCGILIKQFAPVSNAACPCTEHL
jgi:hypothetical protein